MGTRRPGRDRGCRPQAGRVGWNPTGALYCSWAAQPPPGKRFSGRGRNVTKSLPLS